MGFTKTLNFNTDNLGKGGYLVLTFDDQDIKGHKMYQDYYPVVWRAILLQPQGIHRYTETYKEQFLFATAQVQQGKVTIGSAITLIDFKETTDLIEGGGGGYDWTPPKPIQVPGSEFEARNETPTIQNICVGTVKSSSSGATLIPEALLYFNDFGSGSTLDVKFTGRLRIYAVTDMQQGTVIETQITSEKLWDHAMDEPGLPEEWDVTYNPDTGDFAIKPSAPPA